MSDTNYLSPGVYIQELDGPAPITGVSTSIPAFIGMTERGPAGIPIALGSPGDYTRWFGGLMAPEDFTNPNDTTHPHCYLPYAVAGFFNNGGQLAYVIRATAQGATYASEYLFDRTGTPNPVSTLVRAANIGDGLGSTAATGALIALSPVPGSGSIRVDNGSASEYPTIASTSSPVGDALSLDIPLQVGHNPGVPVSVYTASPIAGLAYALYADAIAGEPIIYVQTTDNPVTRTPGTWLLQLTSPTQAPVVVPQSAAPMGTSGADTIYAITLTQPMPVTVRQAGGTITALNPTPAAPGEQLDASAAGGDQLVYATCPTTDGDLIDIDVANLVSREVRTIGTLCKMTFIATSTEDWPAQTELVPVTLTAAPVPAIATALTAGAAATQSLSLASRAGISAGTILSLGPAASPVEYVVVAAVPTPRAAAGPDPGAVTLNAPIAGTYITGATVTPLVVGAPPAGRRATYLLLDAPVGSNDTVVPWKDGWAANDIVQITLSDGTLLYNALSAVPTNQPLATITINAPPLQQSHPAGSPIVSRSPLINVQALDTGAWGQRLSIAAQDENPGLVPRVQVTGLVSGTQLKLGSLTGIQPGTYLELLNNDGSVYSDDTPLKVASYTLSNGTITLDTALTIAQSGAIGNSLLPLAPPMYLRSREFRITVYLYPHPNPAVPARNVQPIQTEVFRNLSMDPRHNQYFQTVIGATNGPLRLSDNRPEGSSWLIRVQDAATTTIAQQGARLGPEPLVDTLANGLQRPAQTKLSTGGDDMLVNANDAMYIGNASNIPSQRTGIQALQNVPQVSIAAVPGQGTAGVQASLVDYCETAGSLFAVLDPEFPTSQVADIQAQRQLFDSKYAAFYYPWLIIPDPLPTNLASVPDFPIPPSGHVVGIYARVDDNRGVFKAPANEVVQGITGLSQTLYQADQDQLNPAPNNINVIRDFTRQGRGIRVWGARVITSDDNYKYVPVRRLLIFIEQSLNLGLQDVVFEPNAPKLWATVERLIGNFLNDVWVSGAFQGATPAQSYFVRCDATTMTQDDIDAGRLIALVGVAPVMPAEFVIIQISLMTSATSQ
jgi:uncharacterized protein